MESTTAVAVQEEEQHHELAPQLQFPPGYHFVPTELELLGYLHGKIEGLEQPLAVINEVAILDWQPGSLVEAYKGYGETKWYFFTVREPSSSNKEEEPNRKVRVPGVKATWKATGSVVPIAAAAGARKQQGEGEGGEPGAAAEDEEEKFIVGTKRVLIYQSSDAEEDDKWSMHEYILKGHAKIGQHALCSIQRKQHSDTVDNAGEGTSSSRKRTEATNGDPGKAKRRRTKKPPTQPEGLQLQQLQETASSVEAPLKSNFRARRTSAKRKNKASVQDVEGQQQKQQDQEVASFSPAKPPLTSPQKAPPQTLQQSALLLPAAPLQGYTSSPTEEGTRANSFQYDDDMLLSDLDGLDLDTFMKSCEKTEQQPQVFPDDESIAGSRHAQYQHCYQQDYHNSFGVHNQHHYYPELQNFPSDFTQDNSSWNNHGQLQNYNQEIGGAFIAALGLHHTDVQYIDQSPYGQVQYYSSPLAQTGYCSPGQFMRSVEGDGAASGFDGGMGITADAELFAMGVLRNDDPLDCLGTLTGESNNPEAFQSQDEPLWEGAKDVTDD